MRVLVTGANGFIGARVAAGLRAAGHDVVAGIRRGARAPNSSGAIECDFSTDLDVATWQARLSGIDAVVNCAGILRETSADTFQRVHVAAPLALFRACASAGVRRVIQLSALGEPEDGEFIASKHRCDEFLAELETDWIVLRPSLVYSADSSWGGTSLLRALAALPLVLVLPSAGKQVLRPIALEDLVAVIVAVLARPEQRKQTMEIVGPEVLTLRDYLTAWRRWFGLDVRRTISSPRPLTNVVVAIGEWYGRGPLCRVIDNLLQRGRVGGAEAAGLTQSLIGRTPRTLAQALQERPADARDILLARWYFARPLLVLALAVIWIGSAVVGFAVSDAVARATLPTWSPSAVHAAALLGSCANIALGFALLSGWRRRLVLGLMLMTVLAYTLLIGVAAPIHWLDPFGGLLKNVGIIATLVVLLMLDAERR
jgi:uncharacterized protein YbjT (DUF2867 family)